MIIGVHGIGKQQLGRAQLVRDWEPAISDGIEAAIGHAPGGLSFDLAFYGREFLTRLTTSSKGSPKAGLADMSPDELTDVEDALSEVLTQEETDGANELPPTMGFPGVPPPLQALLRAVDAKFGVAAGVLYVGELRQVRRYLSDSALKSIVDGIVAEKMSGGSRILVGHSLGSVVAWEFVRQHPEHELDLLVTLGSPLGLQMVRSRLPEKNGPGGVPVHVAKWVNVRDRWDPVACAGDLATWWPGIDDRHVHNGRDDPHNAARYLSKKETGSAIADADPTLVLA